MAGSLENTGKLRELIDKFQFVDVENTLPAIMIERVSCVYGLILQFQFSVQT